MITEKGIQVTNIRITKECRKNRKLCLNRK